MKFFTSDTHFDHRNIIAYCNRPFSSVQEMNDTIIRRWNAAIGPEDSVYHLGDFALTSRVRINELARQLNGRIYMCFGSHDTWNICSRHFQVEHNYRIETKNGMKLYLAHHAHLVWPKSHYGVKHLFGHSHGMLNEFAEKTGCMLDVGVDSHNFRPWSELEIEEYFGYVSEKEEDRGYRDTGIQDLLF